MGLNTSHNAWSGAYSSFNDWRYSIAEIMGYEMSPVPHAPHRSRAVLEWDKFPPNAVDGDWDKNPEDPLDILMAHSDCEGVIRPEQAKVLADRLEEILPKLGQDDGLERRFGYGMRSRTEKFIKGLRVAVSRNETVTFH